MRSNAFTGLMGAIFSGLMSGSQKSRNEKLGHAFTYPGSVIIGPGEPVVHRRMTRKGPIEVLVPTVRTMNKKIWRAGMQMEARRRQGRSTW